MPTRSTSTVVYQPTRTCAGTGTRHPQGQLLRFTNVNGTPVPDLPAQSRKPGRGVYILPTPEALAAAVKRKTFAHKLKTNKPPLSWSEIEPLLRTRA